MCNVCVATPKELRIRLQLPVDGINTPLPPPGLLRLAVRSLFFFLSTSFSFPGLVPYDSHLYYLDLIHLSRCLPDPLSSSSPSLPSPVGYTSQGLPVCPLFSIVSSCLSRSQPSIRWMLVMMPPTLFRGSPTPSSIAATLTNWKRTLGTFQQDSKVKLTFS